MLREMSTSALWTRWRRFLSTEGFDCEIKHWCRHFVLQTLGHGWIEREIHHPNSFSDHFLLLDIGVFPIRYNRRVPSANLGFVWSPEVKIRYLNCSSSSEFITPKTYNACEVTSVLIMLDRRFEAVKVGVKEGEVLAKTLLPWLAQFQSN